MTSSAVNIYRYLNHRDYLKDLYGYLKAHKRGFSYRFFSKQAGFRSPNYLKMVIDGQRNLSQSSIIKFAEAFKLGKEEAAFFENMVHYTQAKSLKEKNYFYQKLAASKAYIKLHKLEHESYNYFSHWHNVAVREMVNLQGFRNNPTWIACHLHPEITVKEAQEALDNLFALELIAKEGQQIKQSKGNLTTDANVRSMAVANFHRAMIQKANDAISQTHHDLRDISSLTIAIPADKITLVKEMVQNFRRQLHAFFEKEKDPEVVYQMNLQLFPLSKVLRKKKS